MVYDRIATATPCCTRILAATAVLVFGAGALNEAAAQAVPGHIYSCTDPSGKRLTSDRPIPECNAREQRVLNADGSVKKVVPPALTAEELAEQEASERERQIKRVAELDAVRRDRNLRARYPTEASHKKARQSALEDLSRSMQASQKRLDLLAAERKPLLEEAEFYTGRQLPPQLKQQLEGNETTAAAQRELIQNQQAEIQRINAAFDVELTRLRALWSGTPPGSLGPMDDSALPGAAAAAGPATGAAKPAPPKKP
jgi:hypothetical protein